MSRQRNRRGPAAVLVATALSVGVPVFATTAGATPTAGTTPPAVAPAVSATTGEPAPVADGRLLVGLAPGTTAADAVTIATRAGGGHPQLLADTLVLDPPAGPGRATTVDELERDPRVTTVEPNYRLQAAFAPNDPLYPSLASLRDGTTGGISAPSAWRTTIGDRGIVVGVLDSGVDTNHPDLVGNLWSNRLGIGGCAYATRGYNAIDHSCSPEDDNGHGTHVAGILGAVGNNGVGITGVAPRVSIMALKMLDANGDGSVAAAIEAIDWALAAKRAGVNLRVLSASWGGAGNSNALRLAIQRADDAGVLFVAASGNAAPSQVQDPVYPCDVGLANVVCVGASQSNDSLASFSHYGSHVDLTAPGTGILSTVPSGITVCGSSLYCTFDGTSMATPMVSGAAVLALAAVPGLSVTQLRAEVVQAVDPVAALAGKVTSGGRLDLCKVVPGCGGAPQVQPTVPRDVSVAVAHGKAVLRWSAPASNGNAFTITGYVVTGPNGARTLGPTATTTTVTGLADGANARFYVRARNNVGVGPAADPVGRPFKGGLVVDRDGNLSRVTLGAGPAPAAPSGGGTAPGQARGVAILPDGTGGYVLDGAGVLHPFGIGGNARPPAATGGPWWPGQDRARGVALMPDGTGGYVVDAYGTLYRFGVGDHARPALPSRGPSWPGWDIARGITITPSGQGGYVVDGYGGIHQFVIGGAPLPARTSGGPYWAPLDAARGVALSREEGGGWVLDGTGKLHPFTSRGHRPAPPTAGPSWPGQDRARGLAF